MFERTLPIGSVVRLIGAEKTIMIIGYCKYKLGDYDTIYDYAACTYPEGFLSPDQTILFNHEDIERVYALGYSSEYRFTTFEPNLRAALDKVKPFGLEKEEAAAPAAAEESSAGELSDVIE